MRTALLLLLGTVLEACGQVHFRGHRVYRLRPTSSEELIALRNLQAQLSATAISFWTDVYDVNRTVDVMVPPRMFSSFEETINKLHLHSQVYIHDVQRLIHNEQPRRKSNASFSWDQYYELDKIHAWLRSLAVQFPSQVTVLEAGKSYEGRHILGVKLSFKAGNSAVFVEGGIHAREWISPATVTYMLYQLLTSTDSAVKQAAESFDWYIFPSTNPDGYVYTHTTNRMWRKSRKPVGTYEGDECYGVDLNRNWAFHWNEGDDISNTIPCSETYSGSSAFSEVETTALSKFVSNLTSDLKIYLSFHSYGQKILAPYGIYSAQPSNEDTLLTVGKAAAASLAKRYGTTYQVGSIINVEYVAPGSSVDWVRGSANVPFAYAYELRDTGRYGFVLPAAQILPTGQETLDSVVTLVSQASKYL